MDRPQIIAGRLPDPQRADEAVVNYFAAKKSHLRVGSTVRLYSYSYDQIAGGALAAAVRLPSPAGPSFRVHVVGVIRQPADVSAMLPVAAKQDVSYEGQQNLFTSPAFLPLYAAGLGIPVNQIPDINLVHCGCTTGLTIGPPSRAPPTGSHTVRSIPLLAATSILPGVRLQAHNGASTWM